MSHTLQVTAYDQEVCRVVNDVLLTMVDYPSQAASVDYFPLDERVTAAIFFAGEWRGAVLIECPIRMAFELTARLMRISVPLVVNPDVLDSLGEFVNMVGGNLKSVLPHGVSLSMPTVVEGVNYSMRICGSNDTNRMSFIGPDGAFWVTLVEMQR